MRISSLFVDLSLTMCQFSRAHHEEVVNMSWVDWCGKMLKDRKFFLVSAGFELITHGLLVQEHNYSATTHSHLLTEYVPVDFILVLQATKSSNSSSEA